MKVVLDGKTDREVPLTLEVKKVGEIFSITVKRAKEYKLKRDKRVQMEELTEGKFSLAELKKLDKFTKEPQ